jgi:hypothetical protein
MTEPDTPSEGIPQDPGIPGSPDARTDDEPSPQQVDESPHPDVDDEGHQSAHATRSGRE